MRLSVRLFTVHALVIKALSKPKVTLINLSHALTLFHSIITVVIFHTRTIKYHDTYSRHYKSQFNKKLRGNDTKAYLNGIRGTTKASRLHME